MKNTPSVDDGGLRCSDGFGCAPLYAAFLPNQESQSVLSLRFLLLLCVNDRVQVCGRILKYLISEAVVLELILELSQSVLIRKPPVEEDCGRSEMQ